MTMTAQSFANMNFFTVGMQAHAYIAAANKLLARFRLLPISERFGGRWAEHHAILDKLPEQLSEFRNKFKLKMREAISEGDTDRIPDVSRLIQRIAAHKISYRTTLRASRTTHSNAKERGMRRLKARVNLARAKARRAHTPDARQPITATATAMYVENPDTPTWISARTGHLYAKRFATHAGKDIALAPATKMHASARKLQCPKLRLAAPAPASSTRRASIC